MSFTWLLNKFSLSVPKEICREENGEYGYWCWCVKGLVILFFLIFSNSVTCMSIFLSVDFVDKRGSKVKKTSKEDLHKFYEISDESDKGRANNSNKTLIIS